MKSPVSSEIDPQTRFWEKISLIAQIAAMCRDDNSGENSFDEVLVRVQEMIPFDAASLYLRDDEKGIISLCGGIGSKIPVSEFLFSSKGDNKFSEMLNRRLPQHIYDPSDVTAFAPKTDLAELLVAPLAVAENRLGFLVTGSVYRQVFREKHIRLMSIVADQLAVSLERQMHVRLLERKNHELVEAKNALEEAQRNLVESKTLSAVNSLAATINHEINNPLTTIVGNSQYLRMKKIIDTEKLNERLERIETAALRIADINKKLLEIDSLALQSRPGMSEGTMLELSDSPDSAKE